MVWGVWLDPKRIREVFCIVLEGKGKVLLGLRIGKHGKGNCCTKGDKEGTQRGQNATFVGDADFVSFMLPN